MTLMKFQNRFPSFLDEFFGGDIFEDKNNSSWIGNSLPAVNIKENEKNFELEVAAPGMSKEDFQISLENNILSISSNNSKEEVNEIENYTRREFSYNSFRRTFSLPKDVEESKISANYKDGVLRIEIPKKAEEKQNKSRLIAIS